MRERKILGAGLSSILLATALFAAEPAPSPDPKPGTTPENKVDDAIAFHRQLSPEEALARGRELRQLVNKGDAQAAFDFAVMLAQCGRFGPAANAATVDEWDKLANGRSSRDWIELAAEAGNPAAIETVCRMAHDILAPAHVQQKSKTRCEALRQKYPPK